MTPISDNTWQRMPWHPKARIIAQLDRQADALRAEIVRLRQDVAELGATPRDVTPTQWPDNPEDRRQWTVPQLRAAHAAHNRGIQDATIRYGEREYQRRRAVRRRAAAGTWAA